MNRNGWTRLDLMAVTLALVFPIITTGSLITTYLQSYWAETQVLSNVEGIAGVLREYHQATGRWFPLPDTEHDQARLYLNPFDDNAPQYQKLNEEWLWRENNHGMVLQLVNYDEVKDRWLSEQVFLRPFQHGEPYLRILLDYGDAGGQESNILRRLEDEYAEDILAKLDDHLYVLDLRVIVNE
ncbi:MAG: hypothetical protein ACI9SB_002757 [Candidatus Azotimanducaceae bacterium]|jgi:hypothetical protein